MVGGKCLSWYLLVPGPDLPESFTVGTAEPLRSESSLLPPLLGSAQFLFLPPEPRGQAQPQWSASASASMDVAHLGTHLAWHPRWPRPHSPWGFSAVLPFLELTQHLLQDHTEPLLHRIAPAGMVGPVTRAPGVNLFSGFGP